MRSRERILQATVGLIEERGFSALSISSVAAAAGVSRQTVYSNVGSLEALVSEVVVTASLAVVEELQAARDHTATPRRQLVDFMLAARAAVDHHPVLRALARGEHGNPLFAGDMLAQARPVAAGVYAFVRPEVAALADDDAFDALVELVLRLQLSVLLFDSGPAAGEQRLRSWLDRWLAPFLPD